MAVFEGDAYKASELERLPTSLGAARELFAASSVARFASAPGLAFEPVFAGPLAFVPALAVFLTLAVGLRAALTQDARLAFGFALPSVITGPFLLDASQVAPGVRPRIVYGTV